MIVKKKERKIFKKVKNQSIRKKEDEFINQAND